MPYQSQNIVRTCRRQASSYWLSLLLLIAVLCAGVPQAAAQGENQPVRIAVLGDSLVSGYGLAPGESFPEQLQRRLRQSDAAVEITNAGVSGDTTAAGLSRLEWSVPADIDGVIVALGANDALRGFEPNVTYRNLRSIVATLKERGQAVMLVGMLAPPNLGEEYGNDFRAVFENLASEFHILLYPFFLEGVAAQPALNQADGMHPNSRGVEVMVENVLPQVQAFISMVRSEPH